MPDKNLVFQQQALNHLTAALIGEACKGVSELCQIVTGFTDSLSIMELILGPVAEKVLGKSNPPLLMVASIADTLVISTQRSFFECSENEASSILDYFNQLITDSPFKLALLSIQLIVDGETSKLYFRFGNEIFDPETKEICLLNVRSDSLKISSRVIMAIEESAVYFQNFQEKLSSRKSILLLHPVCFVVDFTVCGEKLFLLQENNILTVGSITAEVLRMQIVAVDIFRMDVLNNRSLLFRKLVDNLLLDSETLEYSRVKLGDPGSISIRNQRVLVMSRRWSEFTLLSDSVFRIYSINDL
jgi:hypothetical protein